MILVGDSQPESDVRSAPLSSTRFVSGDNEPYCHNTRQGTEYGVLVRTNVTKWNGVRLWFHLRSIQKYGTLTPDNGMAQRGSTHELVGILPNYKDKYPLKYSL